MKPKRPQTLQDYFDIAWRHAVVERQPPSYRMATLAEQQESGVDVKCFYRSPNGCRCLIGAAIADEDYRPAIENMLATRALEEIRHLPDTSDPGALRLFGYALIELQRCHDNNAKFEDYHARVEAALREIAAAFGMVVPA